ncbi:MAG: anthranilate phosphoribosyltransferase [Chloroflexi bacterium]|nr:anthranilate phosphoribosyltransferase [Chloroflexota bacterium]MCZ6867640.1 anthranilate phosphoribosyltransferase [Chloroflexota bacterium]
MIREAIEELVAGRSLSMDQASAVMDEIMEGQATQAQLAAFLTALRLKGETPEEIAGMATVMREKALRVEVEGAVVDTCGTGGDGSGTFNISTAAAFVAAGAGLKVAKHGNRAASGTCGSADVLEALGVKIELGPEAVKQCIDEVGIGFMYAPTFHPAMKYAAPVRRELGIRTVFNILGPLTNPAVARRQLLGVADPSLGEKMARVLQLMGSEHSLVVHGHDGLDELTLGDETSVWELRDGGITSYTVNPGDLGLPRVPLQALQGGTPQENAFLLRRILAAEKGPHRYIVLLNSAAVLVVGGKAKDLKEGLDLAREVIDGSDALLKLEGLVELSQALAEDQL